MGVVVMIFEKLREIICEQLDLEESEVNLDSNILEDLGADSLDVVDLVMSIEDEFDLEVPDEEIARIKTVGDIVKFIEEN
jgi:acyl carrier protein